MVLSAFLLALAADPAALFQQARFAEARAAADLRTYEGQILAGSVALYENRFGEARRLLEKATRAKPGEAKPKLLLAELHYRQDRFDKAAALFRAGGREPMAAKLASFSGRKPYAVEGPAEVHIKFVRTDPLPVIEGCQFQLLHQFALDCAKGITDELFRLTRLSLSPFAGNSRREVQEADARARAACARKTPAGGR